MKYYETNPMHLYLSRAFQGYPEHRKKCRGSVELSVTNKTKQTNKLPSFIDRYIMALGLV
jgi:hypothetical protein